MLSVAIIHAAIGTHVREEGGSAHFGFYKHIRFGEWRGPAPDCRLQERQSIQLHAYNINKFWDA